MRNISLDEIKSIQDDASRIRNICILAHVDHGKTTLADYLIASNGIISMKLAGKSRYMDSRPDEQKRGITMKSSSITLSHLFNSKTYLVNVIDSPGHVDFCGEVSTAVRLCDGAILLIDVVEGVCAQTKTALRQAWAERIKPVLVFNKIDRLCLELKLTPLDAYIHIQQILEQINAFLGELFTSEVLKDANVASNKAEPEVNQNDEYTYDWNSGLDDKDDSSVYFTPESGNVIFSCALDGWGFTLADFSKFLSSKHGIREEVLLKTLWGDYYLNTKAKRIMKNAQAKAKKPLFVSLILENIWAVYEAVVVRHDKVRIEKIVTSLGLTLTKREINHTDSRVVLQSIFTQWLSLSNNLLNAVCRNIPSPLDFNEERAELLMRSMSTRCDLLLPQTKEIKQVFTKCSSNGPTIVCISKMFRVEKSSLPQNRPQPLSAADITERRMRVKANLEKTNNEKASNGTIAKEEPVLVEHQENEESENSPDKGVFLAFAKVFSGTLKKGDTLYVLHPKHDPSKITEDTVIDPSLKLCDLKSDQHVTCAQVQDLYLLMGRGLETLDYVKAGNIVGIAGLEEHVIKSATLSNSLYCPPFIDLQVPSQPILRVAIEPQNPADMPKLIKGLKLLNQSDPVVEVKIQDSGEHVIVTTGEIHLQKCVDDLIQIYAGIEVNVSSPIVPFRETIVLPPKVDMVNETISDTNCLISSDKDLDNYLIISTPNKKSFIKIKACPLSEPVIKLIEANCDLIKTINHVLKNKGASLQFEIREDISKQLNEFKSKLDVYLNECDLNFPLGIVDKIWSFGPKNCGPNILLNLTHDYESQIWSLESKLSEDLRSEYDYSFVSGFQMATLAGPLCEEPMLGVCFIIKEWTVDESLRQIKNDPYGPFTGQIMSCVKDGCRKAFQAQPQRLMAAMYSCTIQVNSDALGKMFGVIRRRNGRTIHEDMQQGSQTFTVTAVLPVIESFQFANEIRKQTSGMATPMLVFSHWEVIDIDPFWVPTTEEEYLLFGEKADTQNRARIYMNDIRRRKGLLVDEKIVEFAEKQRTLTKNK